MDIIILNTKFDNITDEEGNIFREKMNQLTNNKVKEEELIKAISALANKAKEYHPLRCSEGYNLYCYGIYRIKDVLSNISNENFIKPILNWMKSIIESGWTASNADFLFEALHLLPKEYYDSLTNKQLEERFSFLDLTDFEFSEYEIPENYNYLRDMQNRFTGTFFFDNVSTKSDENNLQLYLEFLKKLYMKCWSKSGGTINVYSRMIQAVHRRFSDIYLKSIDTFIDHFQQISDKLMKEDVPSSEGQVEVISFYTHHSLLRKTKEITEKIMDKWIWALFNIYKLDRAWTNPILVTLAREIDLLDRSFESTAFNNCGNLFEESIEFVLSVLERCPIGNKNQLGQKIYVGTPEDWKRLVNSIFSSFFHHTIKKSDQFEQVIPALLKLIIINEDDTSNIFNNFFRNLKKEILSYFKAKPELIIPFINQFNDTALTLGKTEDTTAEYPFGAELRRLSDPYDVIKTLGKTSRAFNSSIVQDNFQKVLIKSLNCYGLCVSIFISNFYEYIIFKDYSPDDMLVTLQSMNKAVSTDLFHVFNPNNYSFGTLYTNMIDFVSKSPAKYFSSIDEISKTPKILLNFDLQMDIGGEMRDTPSSLFLISIFSKFLMTKLESKIIATFYPILLEVVEKSDESHGYYSSWISFLFSCPMVMANPEVLQPHIGKLLLFGKSILNSDLHSNICTLFMSLNSICKPNPKVLVSHLDMLESFLIELEDDTTNMTFVIQLFSLVYTESPEKIKETVVRKIAEKINDGLHISYQVVTFLNIISKTNSNLLLPIFNDFFVCLKKLKVSVASQIIIILSNILENDKSLGIKIFDSITEIIEENLDDVVYSNISLNGLRTLGLIRHDLLVKLKDKIEKWQQTNSGIHDMCQCLLDNIADRSLATIDADLTQQKRVVSAVDNKLKENENKLENIEKDVKDHETAINEVNKKVDDTNIKVEEIEKDVEVLEEKVQEIDLKSVSNAPKWAGEVSKLLNVDSDNDWRLLASRLGYSNDDIRAWSTQANPCMSLLSEWFAVRRHIEATKSILEQLTEMNLVDAANIVEKALTAAEAIISDDDPIEFIEPPLVFLSYQWAVQEEVKVLRHHLQKAGYRCWMDIGKMGGGDKLYEAIDRGIRGAKVFIACVTQKYSESPNCKRELNLSISLNKAVIPLQMEKMSWPPPGTMGPLLTEYIFIRMFSKPGGKLVEGTFWPKERFQELLMQIRYNCAPEYENVDEEYKQWWMPAEEKIAFIPKNKNVDQNQRETSTIAASNSDNACPDIFISYQWGKQEQVKKLYLFLTSIGFSCWMDIYQMGGGDSLYDKIDRGVRGCKLMISCVTPSYSESPNCRREVSLCDNLRRPLIPILLEQMIWPPTGPMSMPFTQLVYISFVDSPEEQQNWNGKATEELLRKINEIIPNVISEALIKPKELVNLNKNKVKAEDNKKIGSINSKTKVENLETRKRSVVLTNNAVHLQSTNNRKPPPTFQISKSKTCIIN